MSSLTTNYSLVKPEMSDIVSPTVFANNFDTIDTTMASISSAATTAVSTKISFTKVWENASPGSTFSAQTIGIDLSLYDLVMIMFNYSKTSQYSMCTLSTIGTTAWLCGAAGSNQATLSRAGEVTTTGIVFADGSYNGATNNAQAIPIAIYGIKGVQ